MITKILPRQMPKHRYLYLDRRYLVLNVLLIVFLLVSTNYYTLQHSWDSTRKDIEQVNSCNERLSKLNIQLQSERDAAIKEIRNRDALLLWAGDYIAKKERTKR